VIRQHGHLPPAMLVRFAWRNLWRHRRRTVITLSSIALGFGLAVVSIGIGDGSHNSMVRNAVRLGEGYLAVQPPGYLEAPANHKFLADGHTLRAKLEALHIAGSIEPRISLQVLASSANNSVGAGLEGMDPVGDPRVAMLKPKLVAGHWLTPGDHRGVLIGDGMARRLKLKVGGKMVLMAGTQGGDSQAQLGRVRGIFDSHVDELDDFLVLSDINFARRFLVGEGADAAEQPVTRYSVFLDDPDSMGHWKDVIRSAISGEPAVVLDWHEMMPQLVQFIVIDDAGNYIYLSLIMIMVVFGILNTVLMSVLERTREFGLLRALGLSRRHLLMLVLCESVLLSLLAVVIGWIVGGSAHWWIATHGINFSAMMGGKTSIAGTFIDPVIYTELSRSRVIQLTVIVFAVTLASGIYPALKAARVTPVAALRT
jgi:putative ABC transport system permease protein